VIVTVDATKHHLTKLLIDFRPTVVKRKPKGQQTQYRFGIGEWYGKSFVHLSPEERNDMHSSSFSGGRQSIPLCPFLSREENGVPKRRRLFTPELRTIWKRPGSCA